ncbi:MAG: ABC transporter substrate-binding protein [Cyanobacteria bacterium SBLK]|nr:ABC transporter substrate-binding protein [Cyanobacteria bacterium SBLK]
MTSILFVPKLFPKETIEVAVIAPVDTSDKTTMLDGRGRVDSIQLYFNEINAAGGINGKQLVLQVYDDRLDPERAAKIAEEIVKSPAVAVLGNSTSGTSLVAGKIYDRHGIPAITGSATADRITDSPWYFRTVFNNSKQGEFIANYIEYVFGFQNIYVIHADGLYATSLTKAIETVFNSSNKPLIGVQKIYRDEEPEQAAQKVIRELENLRGGDREPDAVILLAQGSQAANIITEMRLNGFNYTIFGGDSLTNTVFAKRFENTPQEQKEPGFFTNNLYAVTPMIFDIAEQKVQDFKMEFDRRYGYNLAWSAILYQDSARAVVQAMKNILAEKKDLPATVFTGKNSKQDRNLIREGLVQIDSPDTAVQGLTRDFYFNQQGEASIQTLMGFFNHRKFISAPIQLSLINNINLISNLDEQLQNGEIVKIGDRYLQKTHIVYTGINVNEIDDIDEKNSSYLIDFYLWFKYKISNIQPENIEFVNYDVDRLDSGERLTLGEPIEWEVNNNIKHIIYQMKADFYNQFDFHNYPFDRQILSIRFQHYNLTRKRIIYVIDLLGTNKITEEDWLQSFQENEVFGTITSWHIKKINYYQSTDTDDATLGYEDLANTNSKSEYSQFNLEIEIARDMVSFSIKNLLPLWFFVLVSYSLMFLPFEDISAEAIGGVLLAVVFYHLSLLDSLPDGVGYVVALDYAFYLLYFLIGLQLLLVILGHSKAFHATGIQNAQLIKFGQIAFPTIWFAGCLVWYGIYAY